MLYCYLSRRVCSIIKFFFFKVLFSFLLLWVFFLAIFYALKLCRFSSPPPPPHRLLLIMSLAFDEYGRPFLIVKVPTPAVPEYSHDHRLRVFAPAPFSRRFFFAL